jgi:putative two-component system response regulator
VDDEPLNLKLLEALMVPLKYDLLKAINGIEALETVANREVDLVLLDVMMPEMDGFEVCRRIKTNEATRMIPVVLITALDDMDSKIKGIEAGADDFISKPPNRAELLARTKSLIKLKKLNNNLASIETVLFSLANAVEAKDAYTQGHITRVSTVGVQLGRKMGLSPSELEALRFGGALHDIGKIGISETILNKPGPLDPDEWTIMQTHTEIGYHICLPLKKNLGAALEVVRHHHEKMDGSGYPDGIAGDKISMVARIMAVADIYDALITDRPYRKGLSRKKAISILSADAEAGKLDAGVVQELIGMVTE